MRVYGAIVVIALGFLASASVAATTATDLQTLQNAVDKSLSSSLNAPKKGLCVCISDSSFVQGRKRVGVIESAFQADASGNHVVVHCHVPGYDAAGALIPQIPVTCDDWVPLAK